MNYVESPSDKPTHQKHLQQGQVAILVDAIGSKNMIDLFLCKIEDKDMFSMVAHTILMLDTESWIRNLPAHTEASTDQHTMKLSPADGVYITFDRYIMTADGFIPRKDLARYKMQKLFSLYRELSEQGKLFMIKEDGVSS